MMSKGDALEKRVLTPKITNNKKRSKLPKEDALITDTIKGDGINFLGKLLASAALDKPTILVFFVPIKENIIVDLIMLNRV